MHSIEKIIAVLERARLTAHFEPSFRVIADRWRDTPLSRLALSNGEAGITLRILFRCSIRQTAKMTALLEADALFTTTDGQLRGAPRDPDLILTLEYSLSRVLDLTVADLWQSGIFHPSKAAKPVHPPGLLRRIQNAFV